MGLWQQQHLLPSETQQKGHQCYMAAKLRQLQRKGCGTHLTSAGTCTRQPHHLPLASPPWELQHSAPHCSSKGTGSTLLTGFALHRAGLREGSKAATITELDLHPGLSPSGEELASLLSSSRFMEILSNQFLSLSSFGYQNQ